MDTQQALELAGAEIRDHIGHVFDVLTLNRPTSPGFAVNLAKMISKLSPLVGNLIELSVVDLLNSSEDFRGVGTWKRQDPDFPDALLEGTIDPAPGLEVKAWFPMATEITARFRESQTHFQDDQTYVAMLAWLPENVIFGRPYLVDACLISCRQAALDRDNHYHDPPNYIVVEPEDTTARTRNLQQTNTNGYRWQGTKNELRDANRVVRSWGAGARDYRPTPEYQELMRELLDRFRYRLDTNFAKMDRIQNDEVEAFKARVLAADMRGLSVSDWSRLILRGSDEMIRVAFRDRLGLAS